MRFLRKRLTFANVAATLALLLAMGGGAFAATHYLINSTSQISPQVLSQLRGRRGQPGPAGKTGKAGRTGRTGRTGRRGAAGTPGGPRGRTGPEGPQGPPGVSGFEGKEGREGKKGDKGTQGPPGPSALEPLPSKASESGLYSMNVGGSPSKTEYDAISLPILLGAPITTFEYVPAKSTPPAHCKGPGTAAPGYLCIYSNFEQGTGVLPPPEVLDIEAGEPLGGSGTHGFVLAWKEPTPKASDIGTYTITEK